MAVRRHGVGAGGAPGREKSCASFFKNVFVIVAQNVDLPIFTLLCDAFYFSHKPTKSTTLLTSHYHHGIKKRQSSQSLIILGPESQGLPSVVQPTPHKELASVEKSLCYRSPSEPEDTKAVYCRKLPVSCVVCVCKERGF